ncbi:uncharacterized protein EDB91DRAFT_1049258, partial [Suillus paluster]|uniref:uncharacterized protein n=1 Tax=Suillus paluster TaxID=48578 RepID=UPI001B870F02
FYAVGKATSDALRDLCKKTPPHSPRDIRGGSETGTAEHLAGFILKDLPSGETGRKLLYLTGDKNRDPLPRILESGGVILHKPSPGLCHTRFPQELLLALEYAKGKWEGLSWGWIVHFAPSVAEFVTPISRTHFVLPAVNSSVEDCGELSGHHHLVKVAAIGPTTESFLQQTLKLSVTITTRNPNAGDLADAVLQYDSTMTYGT